MENIQNLMQTFIRMQWSDYLDIVVVAFLIYKLLPLVKNTTLLRTMVALVVVAWITDLLNLHTISWILNQFLAVGLLAFVILFQPEIRKMLAMLGGVKLREFLGLSKPVKEMDGIIDHVVRACKEMSAGGNKDRLKALIIATRDEKREVSANVKINDKKAEKKQELKMVNDVYFSDGSVVVDKHGRIDVMESGSGEPVGALIVFARSNQLDEYFVNGTEIHGRVSDQLLRNLFVNKSPLHDGAVIIQDGKIAAAGCILPVSENTAINKDLGTRHRAAIGISEKTDAVAVVVSEETGNISVAESGMLKTFTDPKYPGGMSKEEMLEKELKKHLMPKEEEDTQKSPAAAVLSWLMGKEDKENG